MALDSRLRGNDDLRAWESEFCDTRLRGNDDLRAWESEFCDTLLRGNDDFLREHQAGQPCRRVTVKMEL
ncbi:hypothetical protein [Endozoicomonas sp. ALB122]|uniref:hypothetical protein n=1 Tax=Endozoicomonas sp. ALB122 TaxID=3403075 RepID=UPI003BB5B7EA